MEFQRAGRVFSSAVMFLVVSTLSGLLIAGLAVPFAAMAGAASNTAAAELENLPADLETPPAPERSVVYLGNGEVLTHFYDENRINVELENIAPVMQQAQVAIEDHRFFEHGAMDPAATVKALVRNQAGTSTAGASSITQQYVKMVQIERANLNGDQRGVLKAQETTYARKVQELRYAIALEKRFTEANNGDVQAAKRDILERYLNIAYYGNGAYGIEAASRFYFNTTAAKLSLAEAAFLAGLVQDPVQVNPISNVRLATERRNVVLNRMTELGLVSKSAAEAAKTTTFDPSRVRRTQQGCQGTRYPFLCDYVRKSLLQMPALGGSADEREALLNRGGLQIRTKIDPTTQDAAQKAVSTTVKATDPVISVANIVEPGTGLILAMAQSRPVMGSNKAAGETYYNYSVTPQFGGAEGYQGGSTFKTFILAAALANGVPIDQRFRAPQTMDFSDYTWQTCRGPMRLATPWRVSNSTGAYPAGMNLAQATARSTNTYYVQLQHRAGMCDSVRMAQAAGIDLSVPTESFDAWANRPSFVLGAAEVAPLSVAEAYATFAARGKHCDPHIVESVTNKEGKQFEVPDGSCKQVMDQKVADGVNEILQGVMKQTGARATIPGGMPQAGKTGTTEENAAVWFAGFTPEVAGIAMVAKDNTAPVFRVGADGSAQRIGIKGLRLGTGVVLEGTGGGDAGARIYKPAMAAALQGRPETDFVDPPDVIVEPQQIEVPAISGLSIDQIEQRLTGAGLGVTRSTSYSSSPRGTFLGVSPRPGTKVDEGTTVRMLFSAGSAPRSNSNSSSRNNNDDDDEQSEEEARAERNRKRDREREREREEREQRAEERKKQQDDDDDG